MLSDGLRPSLNSQCASPFQSRAPLAVSPGPSPSQRTCPLPRISTVQPESRSDGRRSPATLESRCCPLSSARSASGGTLDSRARASSCRPVQVRARRPLASAAAPRPELESGFTHWQRGAVAAAARLTEHCAAASAGQPGRGPGVARRCPAESGLGLQVQCANAWRRRRGASGLPGAGSVRHSSVARAVRLDRASRSAAAAGPTGDPSHRARPAGPASPGRAVAR